MALFMFPPPASLFVTAMSAISFFGLANSGLSEVRGNHLQYSKFWNITTNKPTSQTSKQIYLSGKTGMLFIYAPAFLAGFASLVFIPRNHDVRYLLLSSSLTLHFLKRLLEVQFVHKYSSGMALDSAMLIALSYFMSTVTAIYAQHLTITQTKPEPSIDLKNFGVVLFLVGISGNFYHHYLLSQLRSTSNSADGKAYKIPKGGLFELVICPHYLFEIIAFVGFAFISQTLYSFAFLFGTVFYLTGRSYATRRWYVSKFENFPKNVKALIPYVY